MDGSATIEEATGTIQSQMNTPMQVDNATQQSATKEERRKPKEMTEEEKNNAVKYILQHWPVQKDKKQRVVYSPFKSFACSAILYFDFLKLYVGVDEADALRRKALGASGTPDFWCDNVFERQGERNFDATFYLSYGRHSFVLYLNYVRNRDKYEIALKHGFVGRLDSSYDDLGGNAFADVNEINIRKFVDIIEKTVRYQMDCALYNDRIPRKNTKKKKSASSSKRSSASTSVDSSAASSATGSGNNSAGSSRK